MKALSTESLLTNIQPYNYISVEGFDCVGKTTFIEKYLKPRLPYHALIQINSASSPDLFGFIPFRYRYLLGSFFNYMIFESIFDINKYPVIMDRGLVGSMVYNKVYNQKLDYLDRVAPNVYTNIYKNLNILVIYLYHTDYTKASQMYSSKVTLDEYDEFESIEAYWSTYSQAHGVYLKYLSNLDNVIHLSTTQTSELLSDCEVGDL